MPSEKEEEKWGNLILSLILLILRLLGADGLPAPL